MVSCGSDLHRFFPYVHTEFQELFEHDREPGLYLLAGKMRNIKIYPPVLCSPPGLYFRCDRSCDNIPG